MNRHRSLGRLRPCLAALLVCGLLPGTAAAEVLAFRNECKAPLVLQAVSIFRGRVFRDKPYLLKPGDLTPNIVLPGDKVITIYDATVPNRELFKGALPASILNQGYGIVPDLPPPKVRLVPRKIGLPGVP
jgi:hypothetical protein